MKLPEFKLENFFNKYEFSVPYQLCNSDSESMTQKELLSYASKETKHIWDTLWLGYTETKGLPLLREEISFLYQDISPSQVMTFNGAEEGIYCAMNTLLTKKDHVIVITPCYQSLKTVAESLTSNVTTINLCEKRAWHLDLEKVKKAILPTTKLIVINFPHNPTGALLEKGDLHALVKMASKQEIYIFSDEVYHGLERSEEKRLPLVADLYERGISLNVMSKAYGLPGLRIGWIATKDQSLLEQIHCYKHYTTICGSASSEILAIIALQNKEKILKRNRKIISENLVILEEFFAKYSSIFSWSQSKGGCIGFVKLLLKKPIESFIQELIKEEGVLLMPGQIYDYPGNYFRIGFGRKNMAQGLERLERYLQKIL